MDVVNSGSCHGFVVVVVVVVVAVVIVSQEIYRGTTVRGRFQCFQKPG